MSLKISMRPRSEVNYVTLPDSSSKSLKKRKVYSPLLEKPAWSEEMTARLKEEAKTYGISAYPSYIEGRAKKVRTAWSKLPLYKEGLFLCKQLREKYWESVSSKIDHSPYTPLEIEIITRYLTHTDSNNYKWGALSRILFKERDDKYALYRPENKLKNYYNAKARRDLNVQKREVLSYSVLNFYNPSAARLDFDDERDEIHSLLSHEPYEEEGVHLYVDSYSVISPQPSSPSPMPINKTDPLDEITFDWHIDSVLEPLYQPISFEWFI